MSLQWLCEHGSVITVVILILLGVIFFFLGYSLSSTTEPLLKLASIVIVQFGGTLIVAAIATVIFSFRDIRESIGKVASQLLANAEVIPLLSKEAKDRLEERIVLDRLGSTVSRLQPDIYEAFAIIRDQCLNTFHLQNFTEDITISPHPSNPADKVETIC